MKVWFVFRYEDVEPLFMDPRLSSRRTGAFIEGAPPAMRAELAELVVLFDRWVLMLDGAEHARVRKLLHRGFRPRVVERFQGLIETLADELLDQASPHGSFDVADGYAHSLPVIVICELLGVPREQRGQVREWADAIADFFNDPPITADSTRRFKAARAEMIACVRALIAERRRAPQPDFLSELVHAEEAGHVLTEDEILANCVVLLLAGHETTRNLIGNAIYLLLTHPDQLARLRQDRALYAGAIEETLRFEPVHPFMPRIAIEDFTLRGQAIGRGQFVYLGIGAANRDPAHVTDPDVFDITRPPGRHLAFGFGPHLCLGATLARQEAHIALHRLLSRFPTLRLDRDRPPRWQHIANLRGPRSLSILTR